MQSWTPRTRLQNAEHAAQAVHVLHKKCATFALSPCKQASCPHAQVEGGPRSVKGYLDAKRQEEAVVFNAAHAGRQLEPG